MQMIRNVNYVLSEYMGLRTYLAISSSLSVLGSRCPPSPCASIVGSGGGDTTLVPPAPPAALGAGIPPPAPKLPSRYKLMAFSKSQAFAFKRR